MDDVVALLCTHERDAHYPYRAGIDRQNEAGTALHMAAWNGHVRTVRALLAAGADISAVEGSGFTAVTSKRRG